MLCSHMMTVADFDVVILFHFYFLPVSSAVIAAFLAEMRSGVQRLGRLENKSVV